MKKKQEYPCRAVYSGPTITHYHIRLSYGMTGVAKCRNGRRMHFITDEGHGWFPSRRHIYIQPGTPAIK